MSQGKQAKMLTPAQVGRVLNEIKLSRYPERDRVIVLLSFNAGLRVGEISAVTRGMVPRKAAVRTEPATRTRKIPLSTGAQYPISGPGRPDPVKPMQGMQPAGLAESSSGERGRLPAP